MMKMRLAIFLAFFFIVGALAKPGGSKDKSGEKHPPPGGNAPPKGDDSSCEDSVGSKHSGEMHKRSPLNSEEDSLTENNSNTLNSGDEMGNTQDSTSLSDVLNNNVTTIFDTVLNSGLFPLLQQINPLPALLKVPILGSILRIVLIVVSIPLNLISFLLPIIGNVYRHTISSVIPGL